MLSTFSSISPHLKFKSRTISIDNLAFKFFYRATFLLLLVCTILVTSRQYIGEHIRCMTGGQPTIPEHVINTFCFFTTTFTIVRHFNETNVEAGVVPHPGVGPEEPNDERRHHAYYQWVPFFLFGQAIFFYLPHLLWKSWEGGKIKALVDGLQMISLSKYLNQEQDLEIKQTNVKLLSRSTTDGKITMIRTAFRQHIAINQDWARKYIFCEVLNLMNLALQIYVTNRFLGGSFLNLGLSFIMEDFKGKMDVLDIVFPKVTKCHFYKYGASGSIQKHDALCVMALNVINEKIFTFLWFWYCVLIIVGILALIWRLLTLMCHSNSVKFNGNLFAMVSPGRLNEYDMEVVTESFTFSDWLFLYYLAKNMEPYLFRQMLIEISREIRGIPESDSDDEASDDDGYDDDDEKDDSDSDENQIRPYDVIDERRNGKLNCDSVDVNEQNQRNSQTIDVKPAFLIEKEKKI